MLKHLRSTWLAGAGALLLVLSMTGLAAAATLVTDTTPSTIATFEDLNGNGIDDDCETAVTVDANAAALAMAAVDTDANGVISTTEAAHSGWVGGKNCNHGGYVSTVAHSSADTCDAADAPEAPEAAEAPETETGDTNEDSQDESTNETNRGVVETSTGTTTPTVTDCAATTEPAADAATTDTKAPVVCTVVPATGGTTVATTPMTHVQVAQSDAVGGKNCNHGGAVSESAKAANAARKAAHALDHAAKMAAKHHGKGHAGQN